MTGAPAVFEGRRACVIGWPVAQSRSPLIHGHWLERLALPGRYERAAVAPADLAAFLRAMPDAGYVGGNVTVPHKERAAALCDRLTPTAARTGSVNTLWFEGDALWGDTTDGAGFTGALDQEAPGWDGHARRAVVLGAGGAARAVVDALVARGVAEVVVASRTLLRAQELVERVGGTAVPMAALGRAGGDALAGADLLVNTTPAGMAGEPALDLDLSALPAHAVVDDIVYVPRVTPLLARAEACGLRTVGGLGMLLHQAAPGFARWFGVAPTVNAELRALVQADIQNRSSRKPRL